MLSIIEVVVKVKYMNVFEYSLYLIVNGIVFGSVLDLLEFVGDFGFDENGYVNL